MHVLTLVSSRMSAFIIKSGLNPADENLLNTNSLFFQPPRYPRNSLNCDTKLLSKGFADSYSKELKFEQHKRWDKYRRSVYNRFHRIQSQPFRVVSTVPLTQKKIKVFVIPPKP